MPQQFIGNTQSDWIYNKTPDLEGPDLLQAVFQLNL